MRLGLWSAVVGVGLLTVSLSAQEPTLRPATELTFEVVSVKAIDPGRRIPLAAGSTCLFNTGTRLNCPAITVRQLMVQAYRIGDSPLQDSRIVDGPGWLATTQFEIVAVLDTASDREGLARRLPDLVRSLLEDRFQLKTRVERRWLPVYALARAATDRAPGPRMRVSSGRCMAPPADRPRPASLPPLEQSCFGGVFRTGDIRAPAMTMRRLAEWLTSLGPSDRMVIDRTDLAGEYELDLRWSIPTIATAAEPQPATVDVADAPLLATALREQLGLRLEARTEPIDVLVIESVQQPTEN